MAVRIALATVRSLTAKLDQVDFSPEERDALAVIFHAGLAAGRPEAEVEGFGGAPIVGLPPPQGPVYSAVPPPTQSVPWQSEGNPVDAPQYVVFDTHPSLPFTQFR